MYILTYRKCRKTDKFFYRIPTFYFTIYIIIEKEDLYFKKEIKKIDNAIEFFQSTSEEEVQKYLSYKMGDSKKIN